VTRKTINATKKNAGGLLTDCVWRWCRLEKSLGF